VKRGEAIPLLERKRGLRPHQPWAAYFFVAGTDRVIRPVLSTTESAARIRLEDAVTVQRAKAEPAYTTPQATYRSSCCGFPGRLQTE